MTGHETAFTVEDMVTNHGARLGLHWVAGQTGAARPLVPVGADQFSLVGHLNFIHPHRIQVLGRSELGYLERLGKNSYQDALRHLLAEPNIAAVIVAQRQEPHGEMRRAADESGTPLLTSHLDSSRLIAHVNYYLGYLMADKRVVHGVFMDVMGTGILLTGPSAVGKSELALELITRGHRLVADDAPEFTQVAPDVLRGSCPETLRDFIEVRGIGVLNIRAMFGDGAVKRGMDLDLILKLLPVASGDINEIDRLAGSRHYRTLLDVDVPELHLPVAPGRNLAVLVEVAARNEILHANGYDAVADFVNRQRRHLDIDEQ